MRKAVRAIIMRSDQLLVMHRNKFGREYYTLLGGGVDSGELPEQALAREIREESGFKVTKMRPVFIEEAGDPYGTQYIYLCEAEGDQPQLAMDSDEAKISQLGQNFHTPMWVPLGDFASLPFRSDILQKALMYAFDHGFPNQPIVLDSQFLDKVQANIAKKG